jgi:hypothetical protein
MVVLVEIEFLYLCSGFCDLLVMRMHNSLDIIIQAVILRFLFT